MVKKPSSVEWFFQEIMYADVDVKVWKELLQQAKAMHKEEIQYAYWEGGMDKPKGSNECKQYYNEIFGGEGERHK